MGNSVSAGITATQWYIYGRKRFTATGWEEARKRYIPGQLEEANLQNKVFMVTGANSGIGRSVSEYLASRGGSVYMVCRDKQRGQQAKEAIEEKTQSTSINLLIGDCGLQTDVRRFMEEFGSKETKLDAIVCNAGTLMHEKELTSEGVEVTFATHFLNGAYLLTKLAVPYLEQATEPRAVMVSSGGMYTTPFPKWGVATAEEGKYDGSMAYAFAKRGQVLLCERLAEQNPRVKFVTCHPGWSSTPGVTDKLASQLSYLQPIRSVEQGSEGISWLCMAPFGDLESGGFYLDRKPRRKHLSGPFFTEGSYTKNSTAEVDEMMRRLGELTSAPTTN